MYGAVYQEKLVKLEPQCKGNKGKFSPNHTAGGVKDPRNFTYWRYDTMAWRNTIFKNAAYSLHKNIF